jgi:hypothetical protein
MNAVYGRIQSDFLADERFLRRTWRHGRGTS